MKTKVQFLKTESREGNFDGRKFVNYNCQCLVLDTMDVGVLRIPSAIAEPLLRDGAIPVGVYELEYGLTVSFKDRSIGGQLKSIALVSDATQIPIGNLDRSTQPAKAVKAAA